MNKARLEAFSDGVIAILITIMVLDLHVPHEADWSALRPVLPIFIAYLLSFLFVGVYWNNHHHMLHAADKVDGAILWANLHLLFWLSLVPFVTGWIGEHYTETVPTVVYGIVVFAAGGAFRILQVLLIRRAGPGSKLAAAVARPTKEWLSIVLYATGIGVAFLLPLLADACYVAVTAMWLIPDRRIEHTLHVGRVNE
jgi:uncharacterized membrane protein